MNEKILDELQAALMKRGQWPFPVKATHVFDKDKWQWNDTKRINEQERRITKLIAESKEHRKAIILVLLFSIVVQIELLILIY
tara:strand:+ start:99 stop:347 length:249 start_codon:yes stop_codon:yes gene_type:complete